VAIPSHIASSYLTILTYRTLCAIPCYGRRSSRIYWFGDVAGYGYRSIPQHGLEDFFILHEVFEFTRVLIGFKHGLDSFLAIVIRIKFCILQYKNKLWIDSPTGLASAPFLVPPWDFEYAFDVLSIIYIFYV